MASYTLWLNGSESEELLNCINEIEVEESVDLPGAFLLRTVPQVEGQDLAILNSEALAPLTNIAITAAVQGGERVCLIDGRVLSHRLQLMHGVAGSSLEVWGQDASMLMNREEKVRPFLDMSDSDAATQIFNEYGFTPQVDASPTRHLERRHQLMQRASDIQFLNMLARRNGFLCYVRCADTPGSITGHFHRPRLDEDAAATLTINFPDQSTLDRLDITWDVSRPTQATAYQYDTETHSSLMQTDTASALRLLGQDDLGTFAGRPSLALLTTLAEDQGELQARTQALLTESQWFVRASGEVDADALGTILRADSLVEVVGVGSVHSGLYYVWRVRHMISAERYRMAFELVRNAVR
jgi:phage protein D